MSTCLSKEVTNQTLTIQPNPMIILLCMQPSNLKTGGGFLAMEMILILRCMLRDGGVAVPMPRTLLAIEWIEKSLDP